MIRAAAYCRVSTVGQASADPWASLPRQLEDLRALASRLGFAVVLEVEEQESGAKADRPGWARVLDAVKAGAVDVIMAVAFDRLTRSERLGDWETLKAELRRMKVRLVTVKGGEVDLSGTADAEARSDMDAVWSKRERLQTRQRTMEGKEAKAKAGGYTGYRVPYAYDVTFDPTSGAKGFVVNEAQADVVRRIFDDYLAGFGVARIARGLNDDGIETRAGKTWCRGSVAVILENWTYAGVKELNKGKVRRREAGALSAVVEGRDFPPFLPLDVLKQAQAEHERRAKNPRRHTQGTVHPLSGLLRCNVCDGAMSIVYTGNTTRRYYTCSKRTSAPGTCERPPAWNAATAEAAVRAALVARLAQIARMPSQQAAAVEQDAEEAEGLRRRLASLEAEEMSLARQLGQGVITSELFQRTQGAIAADHAALRARLMTLDMAPRSITSLADRKARAVELGHVLKHADLSQGELRDLFVLTVEAVWVERAGVMAGKRGKIRQRVLRLDLAADL